MNGNADVSEKPWDPKSKEVRQIQLKLHIHSQLSIFGLIIYPL